MNSKQRMKWLDVAKGIAIFCTIIGHTVKGRVGAIIFSFHMPLFFLLAGYTFREVPVSEMKAEMKKDAGRLLIPYVVVLCTRILLDICFCHRQIIQTIVLYAEAGLGGYNNIMVSYLWFLPALFWTRVVYRLVLQYVKAYRQMFILILAFFSIWLGQIIRLPQSLDLIFVNLIFMEAGYLMRTYEQKIKSEIWQGIGIAAFFIWSIYLSFLNGQVKLSLANRMYDRYTLGILIALLASVCIIQFSKSVEAFKASEAAAWLGKHSLALLCIHNLDGKYEIVKGLWDTRSKLAVLSQQWLESVLRHYDKMAMYDSWSHVLVNGVVVCQRILQDAAVLFLFVQVRNLVHKGKRNK